MPLQSENKLPKLMLKMRPARHCKRMSSPGYLVVSATTSPGPAHYHLPRQPAAGEERQDHLPHWSGAPWGIPLLAYSARCERFSLQSFASASTSRICDFFFFASYEIY